jgi:hypothetical protein
MSYGNENRQTKFPTASQTFHQIPYECVRKTTTRIRKKAFNPIDQDKIKARISCNITQSRNHNRRETIETKFRHCRPLNRACRTKSAVSLAAEQFLTRGMKTRRTWAGETNSGAEQGKNCARKRESDPAKKKTEWIENQPRSPHALHGITMWGPKKKTEAEQRERKTGFWLRAQCSLTQDWRPRAGMNGAGPAKRERKSSWRRQKKSSSMKITQAIKIQNFNPQAGKSRRQSRSKTWLRTWPVGSRNRGSTNPKQQQDGELTEKLKILDSRTQKRILCQNGTAEQGTGSCRRRWGPRTKTPGKTRSRSTKSKMVKITWHKPDQK